MIQNCAVVEEKTGRIINVIVADPTTDRFPDGCILIPVPEQPFEQTSAVKGVDQRSAWNEKEGFVPSRELKAELDAIAADEVEAKQLAADDGSAEATK